MPQLRKISLLAVSFVAVLLFMDCKSANSTKVDVNQKERFTGTLKYEMFYGAPGFGEDTAMDEKEPTYILHLDRPFLFRDTI
jgi:hypothetical protein